jgi:hypothetical protein
MIVSTWRLLSVRVEKYFLTLNFFQETTSPVMSQSDTGTVQNDTPLDLTGGDGAKDNADAFDCFAVRMRQYRYL